MRYLISIENEGKHLFFINKKRILMSEDVFEIYRELCVLCNTPQFSLIHRPALQPKIYDPTTCSSICYPYDMNILIKYLKYRK